MAVAKKANVKEEHAGLFMGLKNLLLHSTVGRKIFSALTGLFLVFFLVVHLLGNLLLFVGQDAFNAYAHALEANRTLLYVMEIILLSAFLKHSIMSIYLALKNSAARPQGYVKRKTLGESTFFSRTMIYSGSILFIFLVIHVRTLRFIEGPLIHSADAGGQIRDLYTHTLSYFDIPLFAAFYVLAMICVGGHVSHGLQSAFKSLGLSNKKVYPSLKRLSNVVGTIFAVAFSSIPIYFGFIA